MYKHLNSHWHPFARQLAKKVRHFENSVGYSLKTLLYVYRPVNVTCAALSKEGETFSLFEGLSDMYPQQRIKTA